MTFDPLKLFCLFVLAVAGVGLLYSKKLPAWTKVLSVLASVVSILGFVLLTLSPPSPTAPAQSNNQHGSGNIQVINSPGALIGERVMRSTPHDSAVPSFLRDEQDGSAVVPPKLSDIQGRWEAMVGLNDGEGRYRSYDVVRITIDETGRITGTAHFDGRVTDARSYTTKVSGQVSNPRVIEQTNRGKVPVFDITLTFADGPHAQQTVEYQSILSVTLDNDKFSGNATFLRR